MNRFRLNAVLVARSALRYTPAGIPVLEAEFRHAGAVEEAGTERQLDFEFEARIVGDLAVQLERAALGGSYELDGFIAPRSRRTRKLVLHVTGYTTDTAAETAAKAATG